MIFASRLFAHARHITGDIVTTPWRCWFAWRPVNDMGTIYWLTRVEWRLVVGKGYMRDDFLDTSRHYEYRRPGSLDEVSYE